MRKVMMSSGMNAWTVRLRLGSKSDVEVQRRSPGREHLS